MRKWIASKKTSLPQVKESFLCERDDHWALWRRIMHCFLKRNIESTDFALKNLCKTWIGNIDPTKTTFPRSASALRSFAHSEPKKMYLFYYSLSIQNCGFAMTGRCNIMHTCRVRNLNNKNVTLELFVLWKFIMP